MLWSEMVIVSVTVTVGGSSAAEYGVPCPNSAVSLVSVAPVNVTVIVLVVVTLGVVVIVRVLVESDSFVELLVE